MQRNSQEGERTKVRGSMAIQVLRERGEAAMGVTKGRRSQCLWNEVMCAARRRKVVVLSLQEEALIYDATQYRGVQMNDSVKTLLTCIHTDVHILHNTREPAALSQLAKVETTEKIVLIKQRIQDAQDRQKRYADLKHKPMEFKVGDMVMLKVSPWKGVVRFIKRGKLNLRYVGPFKVLAKVEDVAYTLELPQELSRVHHIFHVSNLKKCYADEPLAIPLEGVHIDDNSLVVTARLKIWNGKIKRLKRSWIPLVKVSLDTRGGALSSPGKCEDSSFKKTYPQHLHKPASQLLQWS
ncbi:hypothetical protein Tco_0812793 [Tanacetum coccineum]